VGRFNIVTCNGCFGQELHPGHYFFLGFARGLGDELVVGINSDRYIREHKGYEPIPEGERVEMLMRLGFIREVVVFRESDPIEFIRKVRPDIHCTGEEYRHGTCKEEAICRALWIKLVFVPRIGSWSTRGILRGKAAHARNNQGELAAKI